MSSVNQLAAADQLLAGLHANGVGVDVSVRDVIETLAELGLVFAFPPVVYDQEADDPTGGEPEQALPADIHTHPVSTPVAPTAEEGFHADATP